MINTIGFDEQSLTFEDVIDFWLSLFPEIKDKSELESILNITSNITFENLEQEYQNLNSERKNIDHYFTKKVEGEIDFIFSKLAEQFPWAYFYSPIINYYCSEYYTKLAQLTVIEDLELLYKEIIGIIVERLDQISYKVMVLETNIARMDNKLLGDTPQEKAMYFKNVLLKDSHFVRSIYEEYQELINILEFKVKSTFDFIYQIIKDTNDYHSLLSQHFKNTDKMGRLINIKLGAGDTHNGGKTVSILEFSCGTKLFYKPRDLQIEKSFSEFMTWINEQSNEHILDLKAANVYLIEHAGWVESIEYSPCNYVDEIKRFYQRTGQLLAILYAVNGKDFHFENIIAQGEYPVLIDLETFLHPNLHAIHDDNATAEEKAIDIITSSVDGIGLLPSPVTNNKTKKTIDVGGVGADEDQISPFKSTFIENIDSDEVRIKKDFAVVRPQKNNPKLNDVTLNSLNYVTHIKEGFIHTYKWILENKKSFLQKVTTLFSGKECRVLFRSTYVYAQLLSTSYHPDLLRNPLDRKIYLHRCAILMNEDTKEIGASEIYDMQQGDIPIFISFTNQKTVRNSQGEKIRTPKILRSPMETINWKLDTLSESDLQRQLKFIDITYLTKMNDTDKDVTNISLSESNQASNKENRDEWLKLAIEIGNEIIDKGIVGNKENEIDRTWIGSFSADKESTTTYLTRVGPDLYGGNSGIALFLAGLGYITQENKYKNAAYEAILPVLRIVDNWDGKLPLVPGAFTGVSGQIYSIYHIGTIFNDSNLIKIASEKALLLRNIVKSDSLHDVIGGIAGVLGVILSIYEKTNDHVFKNQLLEVANHCFDTILAQSKESDTGISWGVEGYVGFSHGNAGITAYLAKLYSINKDVRILNLINKSISFENSLYNASEKNWYNNLKMENLAFGWCHGAPGILLNRSLLKKFGISNDTIDLDLQVALRTTKQDAIGRNSSICHGDLGNLRILLFTSKILQDKKLENQCISTFDKLFSSYLRNRWDKGVFRGTENYGLMVGLAGFGYSCLQFYSPDTIPEILWLS